MQNGDSPRYSPAPKHASIADASDLRSDQIRDTEESIHDELTKGRVHIKPPEPLKISRRVLVATFLLPYDSSIDLEEGRAWVPISKLQTNNRILLHEEAIQHYTLQYVISVKIPISKQS
jgi:hypothetical protein